VIGKKKEREELVVNMMEFIQLGQHYAYYMHNAPFTLAILSFWVAISMLIEHIYCPHSEER